MRSAAVMIAGAVVGCAQPSSPRTVLEGEDDAILPLQVENIHAGWMAGLATAGGGDNNHVCGL